ncbi:class A beta-lactamase [Sphingosinicella sp. LHD-64]|uniref:class A beta-lactamase n=1 Tax=Sphingosinicella sp. LHD-64 TaxID=3072139 RepID=UPI00280EB9DC|nr:class A beta-lactamase [Sphingosinicella sp. LHD-64]MDQ8754988.1 class A beta-lactamase [Sphingosinicella sp. LHD-64]
MIDRRGVLLGCAALSVAAGLRAQEPDDPNAALLGLRERLGAGGRLGVAAWDGGERRIEFDANGRYALCSTFKLPLAAAMLAGAELERWPLTEELPFGEEDLLDYAPVTRANVAQGRMTIEALCGAILEVSDNTAANLLLAKLGGPEALTGFIRRCADRVTRLDRTEPDLNTNFPDDGRDTTTPAAMLALTYTLVFGEVLSLESRRRLARWMARSSTGRERLRAGFPPDWRAGDKTGTGANGAHNDIAFALRPGLPPVLVTCYISGGDAPAEMRNTIHAEIGRLVARTFA